MFYGTRYQQKSRTAPLFSLSLTLFLVSPFLFLVSLTSRPVEPCRMVPIGVDLPHFRIFGGFSKRQRRSRSRSKNPRRYTIVRRLRLKGRRARFDKSNTTMWYGPQQTDGRNTHGKRSDEASEHKPALACLPAGLPASCLLASFGGEQPAAPTLFVSRVACLHVDSLFTRFPPSSEPTDVSHPSRGLALTTRSSLSPALYHSPSLSIPPTLLYLSLSHLSSLSFSLSVFLSLSLSLSLFVTTPVFTVPNKARFTLCRADKIIGLPEKTNVS